MKKCSYCGRENDDQTIYCVGCGTLTVESEERDWQPRPGLSNWVVEHFRGHRRRTPWDFCWRVTLEGLGVSVAVALVAWLLGAPELKVNLSRRTLLVAAVLVAPIAETLLFQALPIGCARLVKATFASQVAWSTVLFCALHIVSNGIASGFAAGLVGGFYFAFTYAHWRAQSRWTAFWTTGLSHAMCNATAISIGIACGAL